MIKVENIDVWGFEHAIRGMRNPMNSWDRSDSFTRSHYTNLSKEFVVGEADMDLMKRLYKAGPEHRKYLRMIHVGMDITAPCYWISEFDTYKVGTTRNSCSFMHKGTSKPFEIRDFSVHDDRIYEILSPLPKKEYTLGYKYETDEYKTYETCGGRKYKVFRNGRVFAEAFEYTDTFKNGRTRKFEEAECKPTKTPFGYFMISLGGKENNEKWMLHRLVAYCWIPTDNTSLTVNHIDGDKGNNCVENLEWCTRKENIEKGYEDGLYSNVNSLHANYIKWKRGHVLVDPYKKWEIISAYKKGTAPKDLAEKYELTKSQIYNLLHQTPCEETDLYMSCLAWELTINSLNNLRDNYLETKDEKYFQRIRCLLPYGYNQRFTADMSYETVINMICQRSNHRLEEWREYTTILKGLPYIKEITE